MDPDFWERAFAGEPDLLGISDIRRLLPGIKGKRITRKAVLSWVRTGKHGVRLPAAKLGINWVVRKDQLLAFIRAISTAAPDPLPNLISGHRDEAAEAEEDPVAAIDRELAGDLP